MKIKSKFYKIYFSVIAAFIVLLAAFLVFLGGWLGNYEKAQPETIINSIIEDYMMTGNFYGIKNIAQLSISPYETEDNVNNIMAEAISNKALSASSSASRIEGSDVAYTVKADDNKVLTVYFKKTADSSSLLAKYEIISADFEDEFYKSVTITMPEGCELKVNGRVLDKEDINTTKLPEIPDKYKSDDLKSSCYATLNNLLSDNPSVDAFKDNSPLNVTKNATHYSVAENIDADLQDKLSNFAVEASKTYSAYMQEDSSLGAVKKYFATDTDFYTNIRTSLVTFALDHEGFDFEDVKVHSVQKYSENLYSCRVSLTQVLKRGSSKYRDYYDKNVFIYVNGNKMSVIDLQSTEDK